MKHSLRDIVRLFAKPIGEELPFFVMFSLLTVGSTFTSVIDIFPNLASTMLVSYLVTAALVYRRPRVVKIILYVLTFAAFVVETFAYFQLGSSISTQVLTLMAETNPQEVHNFLTTFVLHPSTGKTFTLTALALAATVIFERKYKPHTVNTVVASVLLVAMLLGIGPTTRLVRLFFADDTDELANVFPRRCPTTTYTNIAQSAWALHLAANETRSMISANLDQGEAVIGADDDTLNVVLVIGESFIRKHSSLYGYALRTNPRLEEEHDRGRLAVFDSVSSVGDVTSFAVRNMLCTNSLSDDTPWHESAYMPAIFKKAGYDVRFWSNQREASIHLVAFTLNSLLYNDKMAEISYSACNEQTFKYDHELIDNFASSAPQTTNPHRLTIFHLNGQHFDPRRRTPDDLRHFTPDSIRRTEDWITPRMRRKIADYDNATLYNDLVLKSIIDIFAEESTIMVYLSDHGDEVFDYRPRNARPPMEKGLESEYEEYLFGVPFVIWASDTYIERHSEKWATIGQSVHKPFTTDNLPHLMLDLANIETDEYRAEHDILSPDYRYAPVDIWKHIQQ